MIVLFLQSICKGIGYEPGGGGNFVTDKPRPYREKYGNVETGTAVLRPYVDRTEKEFSGFSLR